MVGVESVGFATEPDGGEVILSTFDTHIFTSISDMSRVIHGWRCGNKQDTHKHN